VYALRMGRRDKLIAGLAGQLADAREREGVLQERLAWFEAAVDGMPPQVKQLHLVDGSAYGRQAPRRSAARLTSM
jgi:hypothetical protein